MLSARGKTPTLQLLLKMMHRCSFAEIYVISGNEISWYKISNFGRVALRNKWYKLVWGKASTLRRRTDKNQKKNIWCNWIILFGHRNQYFLENIDLIWEWDKKQLWAFCPMFGKKPYFFENTIFLIMLKYHTSRICHIWKQPLFLSQKSMFRIRSDNFIDNGILLPFTLFTIFKNDL